MNVKKHSLIFILCLVLVGGLLIYGLGSFIQTELAEQKAMEDKQAAKELFEDLATNPENLFKSTVDSDKEDSVFSKMNYKDSKYFRKIINQSRKVTDNQNSVIFSNKVKKGDKKAKNQQAGLFKIIGSETLSEAIQKDLGIFNDKSSQRWKWFFSSRDLVFDKQENTEEVRSYLSQRVKDMCLSKRKVTKRDCRVHDDTKRTIAGKANFTIVPLKINDEPLTYRLFILDRSYTDKTSTDPATQKALELERGL